jgi:hypothetical protein
MPKLLIAILSTMFLVTAARAGEWNCPAQAAQKKLSGAAKESFMKKCEARMACHKEAAEKKLAGAAKSSFLKKCETDAGVRGPDK